MEIKAHRQLLEIKEFHQDNDEDWAILIASELDFYDKKAFKDNDFIPLIKNPDYKYISDNYEIYSIGYPWGISMKKSTGALDKNNSKDSKSIMAKIDTFSGNSGSPIFVAHKNQIHSNAACFCVGILTGGQID